MNRTRLAQLTAVLGAAVLLVLAVAVSRTGTTRVVAGPALDPVATQGPLASDTPAPTATSGTTGGGEGEDPVVGPTATDPVVGPTAADPAPPEDGGAGGEGTTEAPETAGPPAALPGVETDPPAPRESRDPFAPRSGDAAPDAADPDPADPSGADPGVAAAPDPAPTAPDPAPTAPDPAPPAEPGPPPAADEPAGGTAPDPAATSAPAPPAPAAPPPPAAPPAAEPQTDPGATTAYTVVRGDSLWEIASAKLGASAGTGEVAALVADLYQLNREVIGDDPDLIRPGQQLQVPSG